MVPTSGSPVEKKGYSYISVCTPARFSEHIRSQMHCPCASCTSSCLFPEWMTFFGNIYVPRHSGDDDYRLSLKHVHYAWCFVASSWTHL
jgi:hypothetical protein